MSEAKSIARATRVIRQHAPTLLLTMRLVDLRAWHTDASQRTSAR